MKAKVLLIMPKLEAEKDFHHFPFGILALAASLENIGVTYDIFDERIADEKDIHHQLSEYGIIGISMFTGYQTYRACYWLKLIRSWNPDAITIVGGPHVSALPAETAASSFVDYAFAGYAEKTFPDLVLNILAATTKKNALGVNLPGVYSKGMESNIVLNKIPSNYNDILWQPLPYHRLNIEKYINPATRLVMYVSQYGCPALCTFCSTKETRKLVSKPLSIVYKDLETLKELTGFLKIWFADATLFMNRARTMELVAYLDQRFVGYEWIADARATDLIRYSEDDLNKIKNCRATLTGIVVGLESGSERLAEQVIKKGKGHLERFTEVAKRTQAAGIKLISGVVFGFPGETREDLNETIKYIRDIRKIHKYFTISTTFFGPLPGTELYDTVRAQGYLSQQSLEDWAAYGEESHYKYNQWSDPPWFSAFESKEYLEGYREFMEEHGDICV